MTPRRSAAWALTALVTLAPPLLAQSPPPDIAQERAAYAEWLVSAPNSPLAAVAQQPIGPGIRLGPADSDVPLEGVAEHRVSERSGVVTLSGAQGDRVVPFGQAIPLGAYSIASGGVTGRRVVTIYGPRRKTKPAAYYDYAIGVVFVGPLTPPEEPARARILALDGIEVDAVEAGTVTVPFGNRPVTLRVRRIPTGEDESELEIYFRDGTNDRGTYPAGRFVSLVPVGEGRYRLDFNRARNPFCAYSSAFPCPAPWRGNTIEAKVEAGEKYLGGGLDAPRGLEAK